MALWLLEILFKINDHPGYGFLTWEAFAVLSSSLLGDLSGFKGGSEQFVLLCIVCTEAIQYCPDFTLDMA